MVHQYKLNGYNIVLDVDSGSVHVVDDLVYDIVALYDKQEADAIVRDLSVRWPVSAIQETAFSFSCPSPCMAHSLPSAARA